MCEAPLRSNEMGVNEIDDDRGAFEGRPALTTRTSEHLAANVGA
jgi:hypothetical protein